MRVPAAPFRFALTLKPAGSLKFRLYEHEGRRVSARKSRNFLSDRARSRSRPKIKLPMRRLIPVNIASRSFRTAREPRGFIAEICSPICKLDFGFTAPKSGIHARSRVPPRRATDSFIVRVFRYSQRSPVRSNDGAKQRRSRWIPFGRAQFGRDRAGFALRRVVASSCEPDRERARSRVTRASFRVSN